MHEIFLKQALTLAELRKGHCAPNPSVGAMIVKDDKVLATGYHWGAGHPHAEVMALNQLSPSLSCNADLYVTLEPCCHHGKTPPCTDAIIQSGIARVFYGLKDPDMRVSSKGVAALLAAGIACVHLPIPEIERFYQSYSYWQIYQKPYVTAKLALSFDGKIAGAHGKPVKISNTIADEFTHQRRKWADALLTTARTVYHDDPQLNVRLPAGLLQKPVYVLDRTLSISDKAKIFTTAERLTLFHSDKVGEDKISHYQNKGAICIPVPEMGAKNLLSWESILNEIGKAGVQDLWVEAGATCFESLALANCLQQAYLYFSPVYVGFEGISAFSTMQNLFAKVQKSGWKILGQDAVCRLIWHGEA
jgi:diaminohydroxyphosphoribosylaminopyrimidine deaminase/5-amino-6-(5-phosphoribosylamino)uracil reductase